MSMTSSRPYIFRAIHEWITDNGLTPYILVNAGYPGASVPDQHVENGKIILNISPRAVSHWQLDNDWISFSARFGGRSREISIPVQAVLAIYARENGKGMVFERENATTASAGPQSTPEPPRPTRKKGRRHLQLVK
jgi:stringent starvation protein B